MNRKKSTEGNTGKHKVFMHLHICLVEDHYNPLGIVRSLGEAGIRPIVLLCTPKPKLVNCSRYVGTCRCFPSIEDAYEFMVKTYGNEPLKPFVYNGSDNITLLLDNHYEEIKDKFYFCNGAGGLDRYLQKYNLTLLAKECGCNIPAECLLLRGELPVSLKYPVITKAYTSANGGDWKSDSFICSSADELKMAYQKIKCDKVLVQEFIHKKNEYCIDGISINGGEEIFMPFAASYFRFTPESYGAYMYFNTFTDEDLISKIKQIIKKSRYTGIFCVEFLIDQNDEYYFLEVNYRNSGWSYAFTYGGFNLPFMWAKSTLDQKINLADLNLKKTQFTAIAEEEDFQMTVKSRRMGIRKWLVEVYHADCLFLFNKKDPLPFWNTFFHRISGKAAKFILHFSIGRKDRT